MFLSRWLYARGVTARLAHGSIRTSVPGAGFWFSMDFMGSAGVEKMLFVYSDNFFILLISLNITFRHILVSLNKK